MDLKEIVSLFSNFGALGIFTGVLLWQTSKLESRLLEIVEKNTVALQELKAMIEKCQLTHKN